MSNEWAVVPLGTVIKHRPEFITIDDFQIYKRCRVQSRAQGIVLRDEVEGFEIKTKRQQVCRAGEFLVAEIDAKVGGFGIVPQELEGAVVSSHYFLYVIDETQLDRGFLAYYTKTPQFFDQVAAQGSTNYAAIRPANVLAYEIPLPPLEEQKRIVAHIEEITHRIEEAHGLCRRATEEVEALLTSVYRSVFKFSDNAVQLSQVASVIDPNPSHRYPSYVTDGIPMISTVNFTGDDGIDFSNAKCVSEDFWQDTLGKFDIGDGDVIFVRKGSKIGYARLHPAEIKLAMTHTLCIVHPDRSQVLPHYLLHYTRSKPFLEYLESTMNPNVGVPTLSLTVIRSAPFNLPNKSDQKSIVEYIDGLKSKFDHLRILQTTIENEIKALLPSILDRAFRGEL